ncbi:MAG TPA: SPOR domain-containing protein [Candidatus Kapabacteria bacterium]|nr:SPOR domain-containing protein [Candidatus Kapabacteria bacterium]
MNDTEKSYLEIRVTFHHILILLVGVILIGSFLFYLGYQAGKTSTKNLEQKNLPVKNEGKSREIGEIAALSKKEPVKTGETVTDASAGNSSSTSIDEELKLHQKPVDDTTAETGEVELPKTTETKTSPKETLVPPSSLETKTVKQKPEEKIEAIKTAKPAKKDQSFSIQVGAFKSHALAKDYSTKFSRAGYGISISQADVKGKTWYRVRVGSFKNRNDAQIEKSKLEKLENQKFSIVKSE